ncbi:hypothetical protein ACIGEP_00265 [Microbacterium sp. NPDC077663]|uniref:hypothetical protein n=1 Tax=Microbacterium sp. NPDC077663 TaxID=3364189 RepID=UPI0037C6E560
MGAVRYPERFEIYRLEALGENPYLSVDEARRRYDEGRGLTVVEGSTPPSWYLDASARRHRFSVTFYSPSKTPIRRVDWEDSGGRLLRRGAVDLFYPEGDPGRRVPYSQLLRVEQRWYADGVVHIERSSPVDKDLVTEICAPDDLHWLDVPDFGEWSPLIAASAPSELARFDLDAIDAAEGYARAAIAAGRPASEQGDWILPVADETVLEAVTALTRFERVPSAVPVIDRDAAKIVPVVLQVAAPRGSDRDVAEERRRIDDRASGLAGAFEYAAGRPIDLPLDGRGDGPVAAYAAALRAADVRDARWWVLNDTGVVLVRSGDAEAGDLALAVHLVPARWVSGRSATASGRAPADLRWSRADIRG